MRRKICSIALLALCASLLALGTLAYFSASKVAHNVITTGSVEIRLDDKGLDQAGAEIDFAAQEGLMPGTAVDKRVGVANVGTASVWVRVSLSKSWTPSEGLDAELPTLDLDTGKWERRGDWYYYKEALAGGERTDKLFTQVTFPGSMDNAYQAKTYRIDVRAEAVQSANNGASALDAVGWPTP